jgi:hypothetical protein
MCYVFKWKEEELKLQPNVHNGFRWYSVFGYYKMFKYNTTQLSYPSKNIFFANY